MELFEKVWPRELAISGISVISVLFRFRCLVLQEGDFPAILRTIDQTFFTEVRLLILETYVSQECRLDVLITRLVWAQMTQYLSIFCCVGSPPKLCFCTHLRALFLVLMAALQS